MSFDVVVTAGAHEDIRGILAWIAERSTTGTEAWIGRWSEVLTSIAERADAFGEAKAFMHDRDRADGSDTRDRFLRFVGVKRCAARTNDQNEEGNDRAETAVHGASPRGLRSD